MTEELPEIPGFRYARPLGRNVHLYRAADGEVAVKLLVDPPRVAEIRTVAGLRHPGIASVDRAGRTRAGMPYLVMRYFPDGDLAAAAPLPFARVLEIGMGVADALHAAHQAGVLHRDVKPANVLRDEHGQVYLTDFGTTGGDHLLWTAPEVLSSGAHSVRADVFSLGATLWHLLAGHSPFVVPRGDNSRVAIAQRILLSAAPPSGRAPVSLETLLRQAMSADPSARPASAGEFAERLRRIHEESAPTAALAAVVVPAGPPTPPARRKSRWPLYAGVAGAVAVVGISSALLLQEKGSVQMPTGAQPQSAAEGGSADKVVVTVTRVTPQTLRFSWTYPAPQPGDTFVWRTNDELKTGTVSEPSVELTASGTLCVEVRIVRAGGGGASSRDWSPEGCGS
ncbi:serine/threonine-protein kinase [Lentzea flaviverrucosa]|uniref:non-specific serine/threonine protein kinase n=1 Tax=Lentzea flaviverrucosa TaxID=200379 RepID=A0A1H9GJL4_9PSEU|nr:serine/threonine-protein kinase [Lentzea flaviverrucosa]RDI34887.1 serine/threonine protein kinase [Lentzea flaviverrucosa]SEQ50291.1 Serine/threonine protein kinase [Lentzea flaviverrucosa]